MKPVCERCGAALGAPGARCEACDPRAHAERLGRMRVTEAEEARLMAARTRARFAELKHRKEAAERRNRRRALAVVGLALVVIAITVAAFYEKLKRMHEGEVDPYSLPD